MRCHCENFQPRKNHLLAGGEGFKIVCANCGRDEPEGMVKGKRTVDDNRKPMPKKLFKLPRLNPQKR